MMIMICVSIDVSLKDCFDTLDDFDEAMLRRSNYIDQFVRMVIKRTFNHCASKVSYFG